MTGTAEKSLSDFEPFGLQHFLNEVDCFKNHYKAISVVSKSSYVSTLIPKILYWSNYV